MSNLGTSTPISARVAIVILNWNRWRLTKECLDSVAVSDYPDQLIVVVDNGSGDDSVARLRESDPSAEIIATGSNLGFAGGCNVGIARALAGAADYVLLLNNDATVAPGALRRLVASAKSADAAICGARVMDEDGKVVLFDGRRWPGHIFGVDGVGLRDDSTEWSDSDCVDGCAILLRRDLLEQRLREHGYVLDPKFFMYCEDTDLCLYGRSRGFRCVVSHAALVRHGLAKSSGGSANPRSFYYLTRNRVSLANRWLSLPVRILFHCYYLPSRLLLLLMRPRSTRSAILQGLRDGYRGVTGIWSRHGV